MAAFKQGINMDNNNYGGQQGLHQVQQDLNQLQFQNTAQANSKMGQYNHQIQSGDKTIPTKIWDPAMGGIKTMDKPTSKCGHFQQYWIVQLAMEIMLPSCCCCCSGSVSSQ